MAAPRPEAEPIQDNSPPYCQPLVLSFHYRPGHPLQQYTSNCLRSTGLRHHA